MAKEKREEERWNQRTNAETGKGGQAGKAESGGYANAASVSHVLV